MTTVHVCSCISTFRGSAPPQAVTAHHLKAMTAKLLSVDNTPAIASGHATQVYLLASLQRLLTAVPQARLHLVSAFVVPKLLFLASLGHQPNAQTDMLYQASSQKGFNADVGIHVQASQMLTGMSLGLLSQLVMANAAADAFVVQQASCCTLCIVCVFIEHFPVKHGLLAVACSLPPSLSPSLCVSWDARCALVHCV